MLRRRTLATAKQKEQKKSKELHSCGECARCVPVMRFHTLSIVGKPTLGECPLVRNRCVLLSESACDSFIETKKGEE